MKRGMLSVMIYAYTAAAISFRRSLLSVQGQTYQDIEILAAGDRDFLSVELATHPDVIQIPCSAEDSNTQIRNRALLLSQGEYAAFIEAGDVWMPEKAEHMIAQIAEDHALSALCGNGTAELSGKRILSAALIFDRFSLRPMDWLVNDTILFGSQMVYTTQALHKSGGFDERLSRLADLDAAIRIAESGRICFASEPLFSTNAQTDDDFNRLVYYDRRVLLDKYEDLFLVNRKLSYSFLRKMAYSAFLNGLYLQMCSYYFRSAIRTPFYFIVKAIHRLLRNARSVAMIIYHLAHVQAQSILMLYRIIWDIPMLDADEAQGHVNAVPKADEFAGCHCFFYANNKVLKSIVIPEHIKYIRAGMFSGCENLEEVILPASLIRIDAYAFMGCRNLKRIEFSPKSNDLIIGRFAFAGCFSLQRLALPGSLRMIGCCAFAGCKNLVQFEFIQAGNTHTKQQPTFPSTINSLGRFAFAGCENMKAVLFEEGSLLTKISYGTFYKCNNLLLVEITGVIVRIESSAFYGCEQLTYLGMPFIDCVEKIGTRALMGCKALHSVEIPFALSRIRKRTYENCAKITSVKIPENVKMIESRAFAGCNSLERVILMNNQTLYDDTAFPQHAHIDVYYENADLS